MDRKATKARLNKNKKPTIVLMTRWHAIYRCKSRLSEDIGALHAAKIQEKLTNHTIKVARKIQKEGLSDKVSVIFKDYRDIKKKYSNIVSIEMFEAVGERYWPFYLIPSI